MPEFQWISPRTSVNTIQSSCEVSREEAIAALVRRLVNGKIISLASEYIGPKDKGNHLHPEYPINMPLWRGLWLNEVFRSPFSSLWSIGDLEAVLQEESCFWFGIKFRQIDVEDLLADALADNKVDAELSPRPPLEQATPIRSTGTVSKWPWEEALAELVAMAHQPDGLHAIQNFDPPRRGSSAALERWFADYFSTHHANGAAPSSSEVRRRASLVIEAIERSTLRR